MKKQALTEEVQLTILKTATCPTLTGRSKLTYELGRDASGDLHFRIVGNTGNGLFSSEFIAWKKIEPVISNMQPLTSTPLKPIFKNRSSNNSAFFLALLLAEGIIDFVPEKRRQFRITGVAPGDEKAAATKAIPAKPPKAAAKKAKK